MNISEKDRKVFEKFKVHVAELRETRFGRALSNPSTTTVQVRNGGENPQMPNFDEDDFRSFILGARLLAQDNDRVALRKVWEKAVAIFDQNDPNHEWLVRFNRARMSYNLHIMCEAPWGESDGKSYTHSDIVEVFLWGKYSHLKEKHELTLQKWEESPVTFLLMKQSFVLSMGLLLDCAEKLSVEIALAMSGETPSATIESDPQGDSATHKTNPELQKQVRDLSKEVVGFAKTRIELMHFLINAISQNALELAEAKPSLLDSHPERKDGIGSSGSLSPLGEVIIYEIGFSGAQLSVNDVDVDPDRSLTFEITHNEKWDTQVSISSEFSSDSSLVIPKFSKDFGAALNAAMDHCRGMFEGWPLSDEKLERLVKDKFEKKV